MIDASTHEDLPERAGTDERPAGAPALRSVRPALRDEAWLATLDLVDSPEEQAFDRLTGLAQRFLDVPVALVSFVTDERQFFKSQCGLPEPTASGCETPASQATAASDAA